MAIIDYASNIKTSDDPARERAYHKMTKHFGYLPVYGAAMSDVKTGQKLLDHILDIFPGYRWVLEVRSGIVAVVNESLAPDWGFKVREEHLDNDGYVIKGMAGELLERYGVSRSGINTEELAALPTDTRGNVMRLS